MRTVGSMSRWGVIVLLLSAWPALADESPLATMRVPPGFEAELVAVEPVVQDPVAFTWGADGKLWVVEMGDYPLGPGHLDKSGGRVKFLEDADGDGRYEKATLFLGGLSYPTGVMPWRDGVLITCAPDILFARDTDGDGAADRREVLFTGFAEGNPQHRVNGFAWGLDGWLYAANGDEGGQIRCAKSGKTVELGRQDFRIRPDTGEIEPVTGQTQYVRSRDDWGNWFGGNNSNPLWHYPLEERYLRRNPHLAPLDLRVSVPAVPGAARVYPSSVTLERFNDPDRANHFTSACSPIIYRDTLFGPEFLGNSFVAEPVHNLVHREVVRPKDTTFTSHRAPDEQTSEFFASTDQWCRPSMVQTGPDGAIWVADMYRQVIEHPKWIPPEMQAKVDLRGGYDKGRIYRIAPAGAPRRPPPRLDQLNTAGLVAALESPNGWTRDTAQQLLDWRNDAAAGNALRGLLASSRQPLARLHALCALDNLRILTAADVQQAMSDDSPGVRRHGVRLAETFATAAEVASSVLALAGDPDAQVRLQVACTLGELPDRGVGGALGKLLARDANDLYAVTAALSSVTAENLPDVVRGATADRGDGESPLPIPVIGGLARIAAGTKHVPATVAILSAITPRPATGRYQSWQYQAVAEFARGVNGKESFLSASQDPKLADAKRQLDELVTAGNAIALDPAAAEADRIAAIRVLGITRRSDMTILRQLLSPQSPPAVQSAAVAALDRSEGKEAPAIFLDAWQELSPALRTQVIEAMIARQAWLPKLLDGIEQKRLPPNDLDAVHRQRLLTHKTKAVRERAATLLGDLANPDRQKVVDAFRPALDLKGDPARGGAVFAARCATCHALAGAGYAVGPDLAGLADKSADVLLVHILDPNQAIETRYTNYIIETTDGQTLSGIISAESGSGLTLLGANGLQQPVARSELASIRSTGMSLMPDGLEADLKPQDMADLIEYVQQAKK